MAHGPNIISKIKLPGSDIVYEIHDADAFHGTNGVMQFKGVVATRENLPATGSVGDVYHITDEDAEVIWTDNNEWEDFGSKFITEHKHNFSSSGSITNGSAAAQTWTQQSGSAAAQTWTQQSGTISGSGSIDVPKVTKAANYAKVTTTAATSSNDTFVKSYPGATSKLAQTTVKSAGASTSVINEWNASVVDGVLTITSNSTNVAGVGSDVTVATGALTSNGTGASVMTGLGTAVTASALTGVTAIKSATLAGATSSTDGILVGDTVAIASETKTVSVSGSATVTGTNAASSVTVTGTNAASAVTGTVSHSGTTGLPEEA